jgi:hypothetical protein
VYGYPLTGWTGTLFLFGIAVGAVVSLGLWLLLARPRPDQRRMPTDKATSKLYQSKGPTSLPAQPF